jgi:integrase
MRREMGRLSALMVAKTTEKGMYHDGGGLYLQVAVSGGKSWVYRYMLNGRAREMGLGPLNIISLSEARARAADCQRLRLDGVDPIEARKAKRATARLDATKSVTFDACASAYIGAHKAGWHNPKHQDQWRNTLKTYASPVFGELPVQAIDVGLVMKVLEPIWHDKAETASRLRGRMEAVLDWATVRGYRSGENPARWRGHLDKLLPARGKVRKVEHYAALPYREVPAFMRGLHDQEGIAARALEFLILIAARTGEVIGARWDEFDLDERLWLIPAARMKAGREHRVPLSGPAAAVIRNLEKLRVGEFVFPGRKFTKPLSNMAMLKVLERMDRAELTVHGFRSTFRDWVVEQTNTPGEVAEMALAHTVADKVEAAYRRGDLFEKRRELMKDWTQFCLAGGGRAQTSS